MGRDSAFAPPPRMAPYGLGMRYPTWRSVRMNRGSRASSPSLRRRLRTKERTSSISPEYSGAPHLVEDLFVGQGPAGVVRQLVQDLVPAIVHKAPP